MHDNTAIAVKLQITTPLAGWRWAVLGVQTFFKQPWALGGLFAVALALVQIILLVPLIGAFAWVVLSPALSVALMAAMGDAQAGVAPKLRRLFTAFNLSPQKTRAMLHLGALYLVGVVVVALVTWIGFEGELRQLMKPHIAQLGQSIGAATVPASGTTTDPVMLVNFTDISAAFSIYLVLVAIALTMLTWHAPGLVFWYNTPPLKALLFSAVTCLRNFGAMVVYFGIWASVMGAVALMGQWLGSDVALLPLQLLTGAGFSLSAYYTFTGSFVKGVSIP